MASLSFSSYPNNPIIDIAGNDLSDIVNTLGSFQYNIETDEILIDDNRINKCHICNKEFKPKVVRKIEGDYELEEVDIIVSHKKCEKLQAKITKLKNDLLNTEFQLFCLKSN